ncbi:CRISPR-associated protein Csx16 [Aliivibrio fischeri]|uniref:CRISPR-associated protein Csx16 n=1 Tax=Aliivibrio fischeri TaxID=668 RepID=UPI0012D9D700|nr:CRISPR-associated protein Csx16 [Aliivibrio fischeri]MUK39228.1 CRISPR-associated protein Csx16 [Aliivibrio fischeri]MUL08111.1 CRISPR-associated protein Csx16 [Aliivibrio fischeri]
MSKTLFVSRHPATIEWAKMKGLAIDAWVEHLDESVLLNHGDHIVGTLPINIVEALNSKGVMYSHFSLNLKKELRGKELTMEELLSCQPRLDGYTVTRMV